MRKRIKFSQNFLRDINLVKYLIEKSSISSSDIVYEIGAGNGIITQALLKKAKKVLAFELDKNLYDKLTQRFQGDKSLELRLENFLKCKLPNYPYKVFSNIPFNITSQVIKRLTFEDNSPKDTYLIIQYEAAQKFAGKPFDRKNSQIAVILNPWFKFSIAHKFKPSNFYPKPRVKVVLLKIQKRNPPLIDNKNKTKYQDFVTYVFGQNKPKLFKNLCRFTGISPKLRPSMLSHNDWTKLFNAFKTLPIETQQAIVKSYTNQIKQQQKIKKIHRTRTDKNWRNIKKHSL